MDKKQEFLAGYTKEWWEEAKVNRLLVRKYNTMDPADLEGKYAVLKELLGAVDPVTVIEPPFYCDIGKNIYLGYNFYANYNLIILDSAEIRIGDNVAFGPNVTLCAADHPIHPESRVGEVSFPITREPITIEDNVWVGAGTTILKGVRIGQGSVIGAHSVVTTNIPPMVVAAGVPCKVIRPITDADRYDWNQG